MGNKRPGFAAEVGSQILPWKSMLGLVLYQMFTSYIAKGLRVKLQCLWMAQMFRVKLTAKMCKKDSCCILLIGSKIGDEIQCEYIQCNIHGKNNINYMYMVMGYKLAITTQKCGHRTIFGGPKKQIAY